MDNTSHQFENGQEVTKYMYLSIRDKYEFKLDIQDNKHNASRQLLFKLIYISKFVANYNVCSQQ